MEMCFQRQYSLRWLPDNGRRCWLHSLPLRQCSFPYPFPDLLDQHKTTHSSSIITASAEQNNREASLQRLSEQPTKEGSTDTRDPGA